VGREAEAFGGYIPTDWWCQQNKNRKFVRVVVVDSVIVIVAQWCSPVNRTRPDTFESPLQTFQHENNKKTLFQKTKFNSKERKE